MNLLENKKVLVTGANGFIGSWLCKKLVESKAVVTAVVHSETESLRMHGIEEKVNAVKADINDSAALEKIFESSKPELCFHLAAVSSSRDAAKDLFQTFRTNVMATIGLLETAKQNNTAVCFVSTVKVYGGMTKSGFDESAPLLGRSPYAASKICGEAVCRMYAANFGLNVAIARPANVFGWGDLRFERIVPGAIKRVLSGKNPRVNGTGESQFDWVFVSDVADDFIALGEKMLKERMSAEAFNFGSGKALSVRAIAEKIIELGGAGLKIEFCGEELPAREKLLVEKVGRELKWQPKYGLEKGLKETIEWYRKNSGLE